MGSSAIYKTTVFAFTLSVLSILAGCAAQQTHTVIESEKVNSYNTPYNGKKHGLIVGKFDNRSNYMQGLFSSDVDHMGNQSKTILKSHLQQTNRFKVMDRENMEESQREAKLSGVKQQITGARYAITGSVSEFGRKNTGDKQLFGIAGSGKKQTAYAKVTINVVDTLTTELVFSTEGAGEYTLSNREIAGFGSTAGYDATLNGKVLNLAIREAVNNLVKGLEAGSWSISE